MPSNSRELTIRFRGEGTDLSSTVTDIDSGVKDLASSLEGVFDQADEAARELGTGVEEVATKGADLASALTSSAGSIEGDLQRVVDKLGETQTAGDDLGTALGAGLAGEVDAGVADLFSSFDEMHARIDDLQADAGDLGAALETAGAEPDFSGLGDDIEDVGSKLGDAQEAADGSASAMKGMVAGTTPEMGKLLGLSGATASQLGQIAQKATEGKVALAEMATSGGAIAVAGIALELFQKRLERTAEIDAFNAERVEGYVDELERGRSEAEAFIAVLSKSQEINFNLLGDQIDVVPMMSEIGLKFEDFVRLTQLSETELVAWAKSLRDGGVDSEKLAVIVGAVVTEQKNMADATEANRLNQEFFGDEVDHTRGQMMAANRVHGEYRQAMIDSGAATEDTRVQLERAAPAVRTWSDAANDARIKADALEGATERLNEQFEELIGNLDQDDAWANAQTAVENFTWKLNSGELSTREQEQALRDVKRTLAEYVVALEDVPQETKSRILAEIDRGDVQAAERELATLARDRSARIFATVSIGGMLVGSDLRNAIEGRASGGPAAPNSIYRMVERGDPELYDDGINTYIVTGNRGGNVTPLTRTGAASAGAAALGPQELHAHFHGPVMAERDWTKRVFDNMLDGLRRGSLVGSLVSEE